MGIVASCRTDLDQNLASAIGEGDLERMKLLLNSNPKLVNGSFLHGVLSPLHYAAARGQSNVLLLLLENGAMVDARNCYKQTPLMLACKNGRMACIEDLLELGANVLMFDAIHERTCLHYTAKNGHANCLQRTLNAAKSPSVVQSWGFARFINVRDGSGATPLHLAARSCHTAVVRLLLGNGALVCATTTKSCRCSLGFGSTPLHFAARGGSTECVKELLAWGADRLQRNSQGQTPFFLAMKYRNKACAVLLNPLTAQPLVWPSPWKFMSNLDPEAKILLEAALVQANDVWEGKIFSASEDYKPRGNKEVAGLGAEIEDNDDDNDDPRLCSICFEHACTIEVQDCGHEMCASCALALCCHNKPSPPDATSTRAPACPFCRRNIRQLKRARPRALELPAGRVEENEEVYESLKEQYKENVISDMNLPSKPHDNSGSSFKGLVGKGSFKLLSSTRSSGRIVDIALNHKDSSSELEMCT